MSTLPAPSRPWVPTPAIASATATGDPGNTNRDLLVALAAAMPARGFVHDYSCNSVTAGTKGDHAERWLARANVVGNTPGNAHSWRVDTLPAGLGQWCIDRDGTFEGSGSVYWSPAVGFTGGSTTARPTASDEQEITQGVNILPTTDGNEVVHCWVCTASGREGLRLAVVNSGVAAGPVALVSIEKAGNTPAAFTTKIVARWMGGAGTFGNRSDWTGAGWVAIVSATARNPLAVGETPPTGNDVDGDVLLAPTGLDDATVGRLGFVDDFHFVRDAFTNLGTFTDAGGALGWIAFDEVVWPWDHATAGAGNTAGAKVLVNYLPSADAGPPVILNVTPTPPDGFGTDKLAARTIPIEFDVIDTAPGLRLVLVTVEIAPPGTVPVPVDTRVVHDGVAFLWPFDSPESERTAISDGFHYRVLPRGGWLLGARIELDVHAIDGAGNLEGP